MMIRSPNTAHGRGRPMPPQLDLSGDWVVAGDSLTALSYPSGGYRFGFPLTMYTPKVIYNAGLANETINGMINRFAADVVAKNPRVCAMRIGTNGAGGGYDFYERYSTLIGMIVDAGIVGIIHAVPPVGVGTPGVDSPRIAQNAWLAAQCAANPLHLLFVDDSWGLAVDANYNTSTVYTIDNTHMNGLGVVTQGRAMAAILTPLMAQVDPRLKVSGDVYPANGASDQYVQNPLMTGAGPWATGWSGGGYGVGTTATASIVAADGGDPVQVPWQRIEFTASGANNHALRFSPTINHPAIAADSTIFRFDMVAEVRFNSMDTTNVKTFEMYLQRSGVNVVPPMSVSIGGAGILDDHMVFRHSLPRVTPYVSYPQDGLSFYFGLNFGAAFTGSIGSLDMRCVSVRGQAT